MATTAARHANDAKEIAEMEKFLQEGEEPTQPSEKVAKGSPDASVTELAEQTEHIEKEPVQDLEYWRNRATVAENRFNTSKPKYDSNIFNLRKEITQLQQDKIGLFKTVNELKQSIQAKSPKAIDLFSQREVIDVLGQETVSAISENLRETNDRLAKYEAAAEAKRLKDEEDKLARDVNLRYNSFIQTLSELVPDQDVLNKDPGFLEYLRQVDPDIGVLRFDLLREAEYNGNAARVASFFKGYKATKKATPKDSINKRITPDSTGLGADIDAKPTGKQISMDFIDKFYHAVNKGKYRGRHKEQLAIQAQIDQAYISGNII